MKAVFPGSSVNSAPGPSSETNHEAVVSRADRLLSQLRCNVVEPQNKYIRRRYNKKTVHKRKEYQRNLVVIDYPGEHPPCVQILRDYDKVYEGIFFF